ncbi:MAG: hypothetical protein ACM3NT_10265 [Methylocystaceae bacterium]
MKTAGSLSLALAWYHGKRAIKNIYMLFWLISVIVSIVLFSWYGVVSQSASRYGTIEVLNYGVWGACLLLPWLVRSIAPAFAVTQGAEFLPGRTDYLGLDMIVTLLVNVLVLWLLTLGGIWIAASILSTPLNIPSVLTMMFFIMLPSLLLFIALVLIILLAFPLPIAVLTFWLILGAFCLVPGLAPWDGIDIISQGEIYLNTPIILVNRLFCLLGTALLLYIYVIWIKNQSSGLADTRLRQKQARIAEEKAVILGGKGLILGKNYEWELFKKELKIMDYKWLVLGGLGAGLCGWISNFYEAVGLAGMGLVILFAVTMLSPKNNNDRIISGFYRRRFLFILIRTLMPLLITAVLILIYRLPGSSVAASKVCWGFIVVWGWASLGSHFWPPLTVRILASLFWAAVVFFPGALTMTVSSHWWFYSGLLMTLIAALLYRRNLYPE